MWNGYGVCSNLDSSGEPPPASHDHFNHCLSVCLSVCITNMYVFLIVTKTWNDNAGLLKYGIEKGRSNRVKCGTRNEEPNCARWKSYSRCFIFRSSIFQRRNLPHFIRPYLFGSAFRGLSRASMGGAADFKVGYKKIVPPLFQMWGTSKQISVGAYWTWTSCLNTVTRRNRYKLN